MDFVRASLAYYEFFKTERMALDLVLVRDGEFDPEEKVRGLGTNVA